MVSSATKNPSLSAMPGHLVRTSPCFARRSLAAKMPLLFLPMVPSGAFRLLLLTDSRHLVAFLVFLYQYQCCVLSLTVPRLALLRSMWHFNWRQLDVYRGFLSKTHYMVFLESALSLASNVN